MRKSHFVAVWFEKCITWTLVIAFAVGQISIVPRAEAADTGTSTVSAGSAPPPAATSVDSFQADLFSGRATTSIPITVPPGRKGVQPSLAIGYTSSGRNGWLGVGWGLDLGYIERSTRDGAPSYDASDTFSFLFQGVNSELIQVADGSYRVKVEGAFLLIEDLGAAGWEVHDKSGTRYLFGTVSSSRIDEGANAFRWYLDKVIDPHGNSMDINYAVHDNQPYLSAVDYASHDATGVAPANRVEFTIEDRPDDVRNYRSGILVTIAKRLASISTYATVDGTLELAGRYDFSYVQSGRTGRSLLSSMQTFGSDGVTAYPPITFDYQDSDDPTYTMSNINGEPGGQVSWNVRAYGWDVGHENTEPCMPPYPSGIPFPAPVVATVGTMNIHGVNVTVGSNGSLHIPCPRDFFTHAWTHVFLNNAASITLSHSGSWDVGCLYVENSAGMHGPYKPHQLSNIPFPAGWSTIHVTGYNQNQGFSIGLSSALTQLFDGMGAQTVSEPQLTGDADGNGIVDFIHFDRATGNWTVSLGKVSGLLPPSATPWLTGFGDSTYSPMVGDWNGDGFADVALYKNGTWRFATSTGTQFIKDTIPQATFGSGTPFAGDFDGDSVVDIGDYDDGSWSVALGDGSSFNHEPSFDFSMGADRSSHLTGDFNGDGLTDIAVGDGDALTWAYSLGTHFLGQGTELIKDGGAGGPGGAHFDFYDARNGPDYDTNGPGWPIIDETEFFLDDDTRAVVRIELRDIHEPVRCKWEFYEPDGTLHTTPLIGNWLDDLAPGTYYTEAWFVAWIFIDGYLAAERPGRWRCDLFVDEGQGWIFQKSDYFSISDPTGFTTADFNGDGSTDVAFYEKGTGELLVHHAGNGSFSGPEALPVTFSLTQPGDQFQIGEFNGDGLPDPGAFGAVSGDAELALSSGTSPDLLKAIDNGFGGTTTITYRPTTELDNEFLPFVMPVVTETAVSDGMGNSYTSQYTYANGLYDATNKEFRGFGMVEVRNADNVISVSEFHQDYDRKGREFRKQIQDASGNLWQTVEKTWTTIDSYLGFESRFTRLDNQVESFYDGDAICEQMRMRYEYDIYGNLMATYMDGDPTDPADDRRTETSFLYNTTDYIVDRSHLIQTFDDNNQVVAQSRYYYDDPNSWQALPTKGDLVREEVWRNLPTELWYDSRATYDIYGNTLTATDAMGNTINNTYDTDSYVYVVQVLNDAGETRTSSHDPLTGQVLSSVDQNGIETFTHYDALGRVIATGIVDPSNSEQIILTEATYDLGVFPVRTTATSYTERNKQGGITTYQFSDGLGRTVQARIPAEDPSKHVVEGAVEYDATGQAIKMWTSYLDDFSDVYVPHSGVSGLTPPTEYTYDPMGRVASTLYADGSSESTLYNDWVILSTDARGNQKRTTQDAHGRLIQVEEFNAGSTYTTTYEYDVLDNLTRVEDHQNNIVTMTYDSLRRKLGMDDPDLGQWTYVYNAGNRLVEQTDARGVKTHFTFDSLGRSTQKHFTIPGALGLPPQPTVNYTYDDPSVPFSKGHLTKMADGIGTSDFEYDFMSRLTRESRVIDGTTYITVREYDLTGRILSLTNPRGDVVRYTYNNQGGIETVVNEPAGGGSETIVADVDYNAGGQIVELTYGNGVVIDYAYDPVTLQLDTLSSVAADSTPLEHFTYGYDIGGNITSITDSIYTGTQTFQYDDLNRLTQAAGAGYGTLNYAYDSIGNMLNKAGVNMVYGEGSAGPHAVTSTDSGLTMAYDANGNMLSKDSPSGTQTLTFNAANRLAEVSTGGTRGLPAWRLNRGGISSASPR